MGRKKTENSILDEIERLARRGGSHAEFSDLFDELDEVSGIYPHGKKDWDDEYDDLD